MGWFNEDSEQAQAYDQVTNRPHEASWSVELIAGAASYEAAKAYEEHVAKTGLPSREMAKEILAGASGAFVDREVETRGLDVINKEEAKQHAIKQAEDAYEKYGGIDPRKIVSKGEFEKLRKTLLKEEKRICPV